MPKIKLIKTDKSGSVSLMIWNQKSNAWKLYNYKFPNGIDQFWSYYRSFGMNKGRFINKIKPFIENENNISR